MKQSPLKYVRSFLYDNIIDNAVKKWSKLEPGESPRLLLSKDELNSPHQVDAGLYATNPIHKGDFHEAAAVLSGSKGAAVVSPDFFRNNPLHQRLQARLLASGAKVRQVAGGYSIVKSPTAKKYKYAKKVSITNYEEANNYLGKKNSRPLGNSKTLHRDDKGNIHVKLYNTNVVTYHPDGGLTATYGGYPTKTTRKAIQDHTGLTTSFAGGRFKLGDNTVFSNTHHIPSSTNYGHHSFLRNIHQNIKESMSHLVYADWLEEQGLPGAAKLVRDYTKINLPSDSFERSNLLGTPQIDKPFSPVVHLMNPKNPLTIRLVHKHSNSDNHLFGYIQSYNPKEAHSVLKGMQGLPGTQEALEQLENKYPTLKKEEYSRSSKAVKYKTGYTHQNFLDKIVENPAEEFSHLTYADWLDENENSGAGKLIRDYVARKKSENSSGVLKPENLHRPATDLLHATLPSWQLHDPYEGQTKAALRLTYPEGYSTDSQEYPQYGYYQDYNPQEAHDIVSNSDLPNAENVKKHLEHLHPELKKSSYSRTESVIKYNRHQLQLLDDEAIGRTIDIILNSEKKRTPHTRKNIINGLLLANSNSSILNKVDNSESDAIKELRKHFTPSEIRDSLKRHSLETVKYARGNSLLHETYNKEFNKIADKLHAAKPIPDIESFKSNPFGRLLTASGGNIDTASDIANKLIYDGLLERRHRPGEKLAPFTSKKFVQYMHDELSGNRLARRRNTKTFTDAINPATLDRGIDFGEEQQVKAIPKKTISNLETKSRAANYRQKWLGNLKGLPIEELGKKLLSILQEKPGQTATDLSRGKLRVPTKTIEEAAKHVKAKFVTVPPPKRGGRSSVKLYPPDQFARNKDLGADFLSALRRLRTGVSEALQKVADSIHSKLKVTPAETYDTIHDRNDSATVNTIQKIEHNNPDKAKVAAAWYGLQTQTPSLVVFHPGSGNDFVHRLNLTGSGEKIRSNLSKSGIHQRLMRPTSNGFEVIVYDKDGINRNRIETFAKLHGSPIKTIKGDGESIGNGKDILADDKSRREYRKIISHYQQDQLNANSQQPAAVSANNANPGSSPAAAAAANPATAAATATPDPYAGYSTARYRRT